MMIFSKMNKLFYTRNSALKKRPGFTLVELMIAMAIVILLSAAGFFAYSQVQQMRKVAQMNSELDALSSGSLAYMSLSKTGAAPTALTDLTTGITATDSIDGAAHTNLVNGNTSFLDPWGVAYVYSAQNRTISCTPKDKDGKALTTVTKSF